MSSEMQLANERLDEQPFSSETKRMITLHRSGEVMKAVIKGAPEVLLPGCTAVRVAGGVQLLDDARRSALLAEADALGKKALRVLALAVKEVSEIQGADEGMTFLGFAGMIDPPRTEAGDAVRQCLEAGIRPVMITGDHPLTAEAIARELGILRDGRVVTGATLQSMSDEELSRSIGTISVFARVAPEHKLEGLPP